MAPERILAAVAATFTRRSTHPVPGSLPVPPVTWEKPFVALATECGLDYTVTSAYARIAEYWRELTDRVDEV